MARKKAESKPIEEIEQTEATADSETAAAETPGETGAAVETAESGGFPPEPDTPFSASDGAETADPTDALADMGLELGSSAAAEGEDAAPVSETEEDYGALLMEAAALGLNNSVESGDTEPLPEADEEPEPAAPPSEETAEKQPPTERRARRKIADDARTARTAKTVKAQPPREQIQQPRDDRILTIDVHDEVLTEEDQAKIAWHEIRNSYIAQQILTGSLDSMEMTPSGFLVAVAHYKDYRIVIPLKEMLMLPDQWPTRRERARAMEELPRVINTRMGSEIDFIVKGIDPHDNSVVASRKAAMLQKRQSFYMDRADTGMPLIYPGRIVQARVVAVLEKMVRVEVFGVETTIRAADISWGWIGNAADEYYVGKRILVRVLSINRPNVWDISIKADIRSVSKNNNLDNLHKCKPQNKYVGRVTDNYGGAVYIRLSNGANAIAHTCRDPRRPGRKDDVNFVVTKLDEEQGVALGIITRIIRQNL